MNKSFLKKFFVSILALTLFASCAKKKNTAQSIAVFVPGIIADSPIYAMLVDGVKDAVDEYNAGKANEDAVSISILEAGTNQAQWAAKLTALVAEKKHALIVSSNPSLPELVAPLTKDFPEQKFILLDAFQEGNSRIATLRYNQHEQAYITGYMASLASKTKKLGLIAAQEYPVMNDVILPGFEEGAIAANANATVDFRIVGNWYDATKGSELANAMYDSGVDVILPICGGASQGVITSAKTKNKFLVFFDNASFDRAPENILSCTTLSQKEASKLAVQQYLNGKIEWGSAKTFGISDGFITFLQDAPNTKNPNVTDEMRNQMSALVEKIKTGVLQLPQN